MYVRNYGIEFCWSLLYCFKINPRHAEGCVCACTHKEGRELDYEKCECDKGPFRYGDCPLITLFLCTFMLIQFRWHTISQRQNQFFIKANTVNQSTRAPGTQPDWRVDCAGIRERISYVTRECVSRSESHQVEPHLAIPMEKKLMKLPFDFIHIEQHRKLFINKSQQQFNLS